MGRRARARCQAQSAEALAPAHIGVRGGGHDRPSVESWPASVNRGGWNLPGSRKFATRFDDLEFDDDLDDDCGFEFDWHGMDDLDTETGPPSQHGYDDGPMECDDDYADCVDTVEFEAALRFEGARL